MLAMIKRGFAVCCMAAVFGLGAADARKAPEAETAPKMKIAVLDFTCIDLVGQKLRRAAEDRDAGPETVGYRLQRDSQQCGPSEHRRPDAGVCEND